MTFGLCATARTSGCCQISARNASTSGVTTGRLRISTGRRSGDCSYPVAFYQISTAFRRQFVSIRITLVGVGAGRASQPPRPMLLATHSNNAHFEHSTKQTFATRSRVGDGCRNYSVGHRFVVKQPDRGRIEPPRRAQARQHRAATSHGCRADRTSRTVWIFKDFKHRVV